MAGNDDVRALVSSIGEHAVNMIGKENLLGLEVFLDKEELSAEITVSLRDNTDESQREAIAALFGVEELFYDEAVLSFQFVDDIAAKGDARVARAQFSYA
ncbi:MAG: hypothetical protein ABI435_01290 [Pseudolysinimonas sp.]